MADRSPLRAKGDIMKKSALAVFVIAAVISSCGAKSEDVRLVKGTPAYDLAKDLAALVPALDPEKDTVLVTAEKFTVTAGEVVQSFFDQAGERAQQLKSIDAERLKTIVFQNAVQIGERKLLLEAAGAASATVTDEEFSESLSRQYDQAGGEESFRQMLTSNGLNIETIKKTMRENMVIQKYLETVVEAESTVEEAEILEAYNADMTASVRHILLLTQGKSDEDKAEALKNMEGILERARAGEDFAALAAEFSEDPGSKDNGGLYENFGRGRMVKPFEDAAFSVPVGGISDIIETTYGYHILKVEGREKETRPFDEVRDELEDQIRQGKEQNAFDALIKRLKDEAGFTTKTLDRP
jgi:parvulin-like peptidyl-prolyl isomerase